MMFNNDPSELRRFACLGNGKRLLAILTLAIGATVGAAGTAHAETVTKFNTEMWWLTEGWPDSGEPPPAPSGIEVQGVEGPITDVNLYLNALNAKAMSSLHFLLVSPSGESEVVMSSNCSNEGAHDRYLTFDQSAAGGMPFGAQCALDAYKPSDAFSSDPHPFSGLPGGPNYTNNFGNFGNENANGVWRLYGFTDCSSGCAALLEGGWALGIETGPFAVDLPGGTVTQGPADPYPQTVIRQDDENIITDLNVYVNGVFHSHPDDIDMMLEKFNGPRVMLMSDACGDYDVNAYGWMFNDDALAPMPDNGTTDICGATAQRPTDYQRGESLPAPAPSGPYATSLSAFDLTRAGGEYRLWVSDDAGGGEGFLTHEFELRIQTRPAASIFIEGLNPEVEEGETRRLTVRRDGADTYGPGTIRVTSAPDSAGPADFQPISEVLVFDRGETEETVAVRALADSETEAAETFTVSLSQATGDARPSGPPTTVMIPANRAAIPPETKITKRPPSRTDARRAKFAFTSSEPGSKFECKLDRRPFKRCESPVRLKGLDPGRHRFRVRATDAAGNTDPTPARARWRVRG